MRKLFQFLKTGADQATLSDTKEINHIYRRLRTQVLLVITVGYGFVYTCRLVLSVVKKPLIDSGIFSAQDLGIIGSAIFYTYAFGKLTNGFLADHANIRKFFAVGVFISALINLIMGFSPTILLLWMILWGLNGWFQGFGAPSGIVALSQWFSIGERGRFYGIWSTAHSIGEGLTFVGIATLVSLWGWRAGFIGPGMLCILVAVCILIFMRDRPQTLGLPLIADWKNDHGISGVKKIDKPQDTWKLQLSILKMPTIWILGCAAAATYVTRYAINSWGILYLQEAKGYSLIEAGGMLGITTVSGIVGCLAYGFASDKLFKARRPPVTLIFGLIEIASLLVIFYAPAGNPVLLTVAFALYGFSLNGLVTTLGGLFATDIAPKKVAGAVMGFIGVFSYLSAATQDLISGYLIENGMTIIDGVRTYDFSTVIVFWIGGAVAALILASILWNVKPVD